METITELFKGILNAVNNGAWRIAVAGTILIAVQIAKVYLPKVTGKFAWLVAVAMGALWGLGSGLSQVTITFGAVMAQVVNGVMVGLMGSGIFEGLKNAVKVPNDAVLPPTPGPTTPDRAPSTPPDPPVQL